jgi:hypothetical protein
MTEDNKHNLLYFESDNMKKLYDIMEEWQRSNSKRLLSTNIQKDRGKFCCIALSNPTEVIICSGGGGNHVDVKDGYLDVNPKFW